MMSSLELSGRRGGKVIFTYPNNFDIENIAIHVEDHLGHHATVEVDLSLQLYEFINGSFASKVICMGER